MTPLYRQQATAAAINIGKVLQRHPEVDEDIALHHGFEIVENFTFLDLAEEYRHQVALLNNRSEY